MGRILLCYTYTISTDITPLTIESRAFRDNSCHAKGQEKYHQGAEINRLLTRTNDHATTAVRSSEVRERTWLNTRLDGGHNIATLQRYPREPDHKTVRYDDFPELDNTWVTRIRARKIM
ncbi:hypothetical protein ECG_06394 [Echinococcus granulosus]|nr:hypothetical protein ECG_06394 [Echinococcus granulosus]